MATNMITVKLQIPRQAEYERLGAWFDTLSSQKQAQFQQEWHALKDAGAEVADAGYSYGVIHCWISDDFRQHCRKFGFEFRQD